MNTDVRSRIEQLIKSSAPTVAQAWIDHRQKFAAAYEARMYSFLQNRKRFPSRWQEETLLFVPFAGMPESDIIAMTSNVRRALETAIPELIDFGNGLGDELRSIPDCKNPLPICGSAIARCVLPWLKRLIADLVQGEPDKDRRTKLALAHWVMMRGAYGRWNFNTTILTLKSWKEEVILQILVELGSQSIDSVKTMRIIFNMDLRSARDSVLTLEKNWKNRQSLKP